MEGFRCLHKLVDINNKAYAYLLINKSGKKVFMAPDDIRKQIRSESITVEMMKLNSLGNLVDLAFDDQEYINTYNEKVSICLKGLKEYATYKNIIYYIPSTLNPHIPIIGKEEGYRAGLVIRLDDNIPFCKGLQPAEIIAVLTDTIEQYVNEESKEGVLTPATHVFMNIDGSVVGTIRISKNSYLKVCFTSDTTKDMIDNADIKGFGTVKGAGVAELKSLSRDTHKGKISGVSGKVQKVKIDFNTLDMDNLEKTAIVQDTIKRAEQWNSYVHSIEKMYDDMSDDECANYYTHKLNELYPNYTSKTLDWNDIKGNVTYIKVKFLKSFGYTIDKYFCIDQRIEDEFIRGIAKAIRKRASLLGGIEIERYGYRKPVNTFVTVDQEINYSTFKHYEKNEHGLKSAIYQEIPDIKYIVDYGNPEYIMPKGFILRLLKYMYKAADEMENNTYFIKQSYNTNIESEEMHEIVSKYPKSLQYLYEIYGVPYTLLVELIELIFMYMQNESNCRFYFYHDGYSCMNENTDYHLVTGHSIYDIISTVGRYAEESGLDLHKEELLKRLDTLDGAPEGSLALVINHSLESLPDDVFYDIIKASIKGREKYELYLNKLAILKGIDLRDELWRPN